MHFFCGKWASSQPAGEVFPPCPSPPVTAAAWCCGAFRLPIPGSFHWLVDPFLNFFDITLSRASVPGCKPRFSCH